MEKTHQLRARVADIKNWNALAKVFSVKGRSWKRCIVTENDVNLLNKKLKKV